ncbi:MAG: ParB/RepB/Spo0J family partition protein [Acidobacteria bacterium]|nr:ParB/RepB/Spo0J family partition protein [Acidobacteriota bacterium]
MNVIAPPTGTAVREIPLDRLFPAPGNVRRTPPGAQADAELKASIAALGLLENLVVREDDDGRHAVIAGARRLKALQALAEDGTIDPGRPVPCQVLPGEVDAEEISLAENVVRIAMHPADQVVAFSRLAEAGQTVASIAARFGASERTVEQRLRLGGVAPDLLHALRAGEIDLEILKAFAVTTDPARQIAVWDQVSAQGHPPSAWQVRRLLTEERVPGTSALARFVGVEAYEAAGGAVIRDLFARDDETGTWFEDPALLERLAGERLKAAADELATRWKWAAAMTEVSWQDTARYGRVHPEPSDPTDEEAAEVERLEARQEELCNLDDDWTEALDAEAGAVEARLDEIGRAILARATYSREDMALAGCIVTVGHDGTMEVVQGLVRPEDMPETAETDGDDATATESGTGVHAPRIAGPAVATDLPKDREAGARKQAGIGIGLADDLRAIRTALVKAHLAGSFAAAFDLALFQLARSVFRWGHAADALDITVRESADRPMTRTTDEAFADWSPGEAMLEDRSGLALDWMEIEDDGAAFAALRALRDPDKRALFAACVARTVRPQLAFEPQARPELEATIARLGIDFAAHVRPTADMFWSRIAKGRMLEIARETLGVAWADARAKLKKPELAEAMEAAFAAGDRPVGTAAGAHAAAVAWTPPGFAAFDAGRADAGAEPQPDDDAAEAKPGAEADGAADAVGAVDGTDPAVGAGATGAGEAEATEPDSGAAAPEGGATNGVDADAGTDPQDGDGEADPVLATVKSVVANAVARARPADVAPPDADAQDGTDANAVPANGHDPSAEPAEIPAFLRNAG